MPPTYYTFECSCCLDPYESALKRRYPPTPLRRRCDACVRSCAHPGGDEPRCSRRVARGEVPRMWQQAG